MTILTAQDIAGMIELNLLAPDLTTDDVKRGCELARDHQIAAVCVRPSDVSIARRALENSGVAVTSVIGFPFGANVTEAKVFESTRVVAMGCSEISVVLNIGKYISGDLDYIQDELMPLVAISHEKNIPVTVIFETKYLNKDQIIEICNICNGIGVDYTKNSTGFIADLANLEDLKVLRENTNANMYVKAAGVKNLDDALLVKSYGCSRFDFGPDFERLLNEAAIRELNGKLCF